ncbi:molybdenum cofactor biosynthesis protein MoaE [Terasakiella pusilla]|uniref:molybdenum cofactor biosynthesis protein MoaE n=1 Tax=Terasakiella pusilla TaxID=64973 RepID=UPI003AA8F7AF
MIRVQAENFDVGAEINALSNGNTAIGGICSFVGLVRDFQHSKDDATRVSAMTLEHYPGMTEKKLQEIEEIARNRWPLEDVLIIHRYGRMEPGENIVLVVTASAHRKAAFEACEFLMDYLKTKAPFWKLEEDEKGEGSWVDAREADNAAAQKWDPSTGS